MQSDQSQPKLSCKHVWKVYGTAGDQVLKDKIHHAQSAAATKPFADGLRADGDVVACEDVSFDVMPGEIFVIMGLSGSGKSTIVRCLSRLVEPTAGEIWLDGENLLEVSQKDLIEMRRHKMGMVFQSFGLMPHLNVLDNVALPLKLQGLRLKDRQSRARDVIEKVGLAGRETSFPSQLSGGQQQRVGIARSLAVEPEIWFLDEPFSALDPLIRRQMQDEFLRLQSELNKSIVFITHDFLEALRIADRMAIMKDGAVVQIGKPVDLILNPTDDYVRKFTNDVPWELVLTAGDVASATPPPAGLKEVQDDIKIASLLPYLAQHDDGVAVCQPGGALGHLVARDVISALASGVSDAAAVKD